MAMLLTREAVMAHQLLIKTRATRALWGLVISAIPLVIGFFLLVLYTPDQREAPRLVQTWERVFSALALASFLGGGAWSVYCVSCAELQLRCPGCRASIGDLHNLFAVMASKRCPHCEQVIVGEAGTPFENRVHGTPQRSFARLASKETLWLVAI